MPERSKIAGVILAGGKGKRFDGANKALLMLGGKPFLIHVASRLKPQVGILAVNANRDLHEFLASEFKLLIAADGIGKTLGPLDGILGAMLFAEAHHCSHVLTVSVDTPFIPHDLVDCLAAKKTGQATIATSNGRIHGTTALWPVTLAAGLKTYIESGNSLKVMSFLETVGFGSVDFPGTDPDPFFNINTPDDLAAAAHWLKHHQN
jgi:molybdenum cofactor guanylyltransferase